MYGEYIGLAFAIRVIGKVEGAQVVVYTEKSWWSSRRGCGSLIHRALHKLVPLLHRLSY